MIRELLLGVHAAAWLVVVVITAARTGVVPPELWAVLPFGIGTILAAFRADRRLSKPASSSRKAGHRR
jgi:hypothetical protein